VRGGTADIVLWRQQIAAIKMTVTTQDVAAFDEQLYQLAFIGPYIKGVTQCITHKN
jgi:hypothetical protein